MRGRGRGRAVGYGELGQDVRDVDAHGLLADEERTGDLAVRAAVAEQLEHFLLAAGEAERGLMLRCHLSGAPVDDEIDPSSPGQRLDLAEQRRGAKSRGDRIRLTQRAGGSTPSLRPSQLGGRTGTLTLAGIVTGPVRGDAHAGGLIFKLKDFDGPVTVPVVYAGSVPDLFRVGRHVYMEGSLQGGRFVAKPGTMITKCPSKYAPKKKEV